MGLCGLISKVGPYEWGDMMRRDKFIKVVTVYIYFVADTCMLYMWRLRDGKTGYMGKGIACEDITNQI
jgi:hypothetical protein